MLICTLCRAENFQEKVKIDSVPKTGFYKIILSPEIISVTKTGYSDIRIYDAKQNEAPYILIENQDSLYTSIPKPAIEQTDSADIKKSFITLTFDRPYEISKMELMFRGPELYLRIGVIIGLLTCLSIFLAKETRKKSNRKKT